MSLDLLKTAVCSTPGKALALNFMSSGIERICHDVYDETGYDFMQWEISFKKKHLSLFALSVLRTISQASSNYLLIGQLTSFAGIGVLPFSYVGIGVVSIILIDEFSYDLSLNGSLVTEFTAFLRNDFLRVAAHVSLFVKGGVLLGTAISSGGLLVGLGGVAIMASTGGLICLSSKTSDLAGFISP